MILKTDEGVLAQLQAHFTAINNPPMGWSSNTRLYEVVGGVARRRHDYPHLKSACQALQVHQHENPQNEYGLMVTCIADAGHGFNWRIWGYLDIPDRVIYAVLLHWVGGQLCLQFTAMVDGWPRFCSLQVADPSSEVGRFAADLAEQAKRFMQC